MKQLNLYARSLIGGTVEKEQERDIQDFIIDEIAV